jgi:tetratricopeptide (TPR) repeat protein
MDWITLLRSLQSDFIKRLTSGCLLHCETEGQYSELTVISGERLKALREFCWQMAEKYKRTSPVRDVFISNLKGKLGEEVVKERLDELVTEVDYERRWGGDGKVDFTLTYDSSVGIAVKSRHGSFDKVRWSISSEEVERNAVVVCVLIQEDVHEAQPEYHLFLAGFLPTRMIKLRTGKISFGIDQLLYGSGLRCYLEHLQSSINYNPYKQKYQIYQPNLKQESFYKQSNNQFLKPQFQPHEDDYSRYRDADLNLLYVKLGDEYCDKGQYEAAITSYNKALRLNPKDASIYYKRGDARYALEDYEGAIVDFSQAITINPHYAKAYNRIGNAHYHLGDYEGAIADYTQAIRINSNDAVAYRNRADARFHQGDNEGAIEDCTQAIKINPYLLGDQQQSSHPIKIYQKNNSVTSKRGDTLSELEHYKRAIDIFTQVLEISPNNADAYYNRGNIRSDIGDYEGAISDYTQAIKFNPNNADAYYNCGNIRFDLGDCEGAISDYTQAIKINHNDADAYYNRGNARYHQGDKPRAIEDFQKAMELYRKEGKLAEQKNAKERILDLEIEESLDILNF